MSYPNNHKHKFFQKDHEKMMCSECEFELDGEYYVQYVVPLEQENKELRTRVAELEVENKVWTEASELWVNVGHQNAELQNRLSTLLKASEGMENALEYITDNLEEDGTKWVMDTAEQALADFRAVKEGK